MEAPLKNIWGEPDQVGRSLSLWWDIRRLKADLADLAKQDIAVALYEPDAVLVTLATTLQPDLKAVIATRLQEKINELTAEFLILQPAYAMREFINTPQEEDLWIPGQLLRIEVNYSSFSVFFQSNNPTELEIRERIYSVADLPSFFRANGMLRPATYVTRPAIKSWFEAGKNSLESVIEGPLPAES